MASATALDSRTALDNRIEIVTPENIAFHYRVAGPFQRLPAYMIDFFLRFGMLMFIGIAVSFTVGAVLSEKIAMGIMLVVWFVLSWFYGGLFETFWNGQTPGKRMLGLRVLTVEGQPINALQAVLRNVLRSADALPLAPPAMPVVPLYMLGLLSCALTDRYQRLGDLACGTMVVIEDRKRLGGVLQVADEPVLAVARLLPAQVSISRSLARTLSMYVGRRWMLTPMRRLEVARSLAEPLIVKFDLPSHTNYDLLLCALYYRAFVSDRAEEVIEVQMLDEPVGVPAPVTVPAPGPPLPYIPPWERGR